MQDRQAKGEIHGRSKLTEQDISTIRQLCQNGAYQYVVAAKFGVSQAQIGNIVNGKSWAHI